MPAGRDGASTLAGYFVNMEEIMIKRLVEGRRFKSFKLTREKPYKISGNSQIRIPGNCMAAPSDRYYIYEDHKGNMLLVREAK